MQTRKLSNNNARIETTSRLRGLAIVSSLGGVWVKQELWTNQSNKDLIRNSLYIQSWSRLQHYQTLFWSIINDGNVRAATGAPVQRKSFQSISGIPPYSPQSARRLKGSPLRLHRVCCDSRSIWTNVIICLDFPFIRFHCHSANLLLWKPEKLDIQPIDGLQSKSHPHIDCDHQIVSHFLNLKVDQQLQLSVVPNRANNSSIYLEKYAHIGTKTDKPGGHTKIYISNLCAKLANSVLLYQQMTADPIW